MLGGAEVLKRTRKYRLLLNPFSQSPFHVSRCGSRELLGSMQGPTLTL